MIEFITNSPEETEKLGVKLGTFLKPGDFVNLIGDLGAGKTLFVKGIASSLNISSREVTSPTFTLINEYTGTIPVFHFDVYRLEHQEELEDLGYEEYFFGEGVTLVEWGDQIPNYVPDERLEIVFHRIDEKTRKLGFTAKGSRYEQLVRGFKEGVLR